MSGEGGGRQPSAHLSMSVKQQRVGSVVLCAMAPAVPVLVHAAVDYCAPLPLLERDWVGLTGCRINLTPWPLSMTPLTVSR